MVIIKPTPKTKFRLGNRRKLGHFMTNPKQAPVETELDKVLKKHIQHADGFGAYTIEEDRMDSFESDLKALIHKEVLKARITELEDLWTSGKSLHADIRVGYEKGLTVHERIRELKALQTKEIKDA